jgi:hypothetical protein
MNAMASSTNFSTSLAGAVVLEAVLGRVVAVALDVVGDLGVVVVVGVVATTESSRTISAATPAAINSVTTPTIAATMTVDGPGERGDGVASP